MSPRYLGRKVLQAIVTIVFVVILNFMLFRLMPGSPERVLLRNPHLDAQTIEDARRNRHVIELRPWMRWAVAAAAVLILGIGIGRWTAHQPSVGTGTTTVATADSTTPAQSDLIYQVAATQYLSHTEAFLTSFRADVGLHRGANSARFTRQARDLLSTTRLMLDSPAANDAYAASIGPACMTRASVVRWPMTRQMTQDAKRFRVIPESREVA